MGHWHRARTPQKKVLSLLLSSLSAGGGVCSSVSGYRGGTAKACWSSQQCPGTGSSEHPGPGLETFSSSGQGHAGGTPVLAGGGMTANWTKLEGMV